MPALEVQFICSSNFYALEFVGDFIGKEDPNLLVSSGIENLSADLCSRAFFFLCIFGAIFDSRVLLNLFAIPL